MRWKKEWVLDDKAVSAQKRAANVIKHIVESANTSLKCTVETGEDYADGRLPALDRNRWVEGNVYLL